MAAPEVYREVLNALPEKGVDYYETAGALRVTERPTSLSQRSELTRDASKLMLVMVGMPARGKSYISAKLFSYLSWIGFKTRVFNVGQHRRCVGGDGRASSEASFFDSKNAEAKAKREALAMDVLKGALSWLDSGGEIAIFDATNSTRARRDAITMKCGRVAVVFVESVCDDEAVLESNMRTKVASSPDFAEMNLEVALEDLRQRIRNYERAYQTVRDEEGAYIKLYNFSSKVTANQCYGRMSKVVVPYVMAIHADDRPVYITALAPGHQEPEFSKEVHGNAKEDFFETRLAHWWWHQNRSGRLQIVSSTMPLAIDAAMIVQSRGHPGKVNINHTSALNPLLLDKKKRTDFHDRGDYGESYADLVGRLESAILDIEASVDPVLVITHATPARALRAYFKNIPVMHVQGATTSPETKALADAVPAVLELAPKIGGGWQETVHLM